MSTDEGRIHERVGCARRRHSAGRAALGLFAVVDVGVGFGLLLLPVRLHW